MIVTLSGRALLEKYGLTPKLPAHIDHSFSGTYEACNRLAWYQYIIGRVPAYREQTALVWGATFHTLAEIWQTQDDKKVALEMVEHVITTNIEEENEDKYGRNAPRMRELFAEWVIFRHETRDAMEIIRPEQAVVVICKDPCMYNDGPLGCDLEYGGRLDDIVKWQGQVGPLDLKTTVMKYNDPVTQYRPDHQMEGYVWCSSHLIGEHCWGAIIERLVCNKGNIDISRFPIPYARDLIREWAEGERLRQLEIREKFEKHGWDEAHWRQDFTHCWSPWPCQFRDFCLSPRDMDFRYKRLREHTREKRWDFQRMED